MTACAPSAMVRLAVQGRDLDIETAWVGPARAAGPVVLFLHEGLGSVALWKDFPDRFCRACGLRGLVYSRPGYGRSTPRAAGEVWAGDFMHRQAQQVLPALRDALGLDAPVWLFGHSDGGSIALLHAAHAPARVAGVMALAPHVFVEPITLAGIRVAREAWLHGSLRSDLAHYHADAESAFGGWCGAWLEPRFADWNIEPALATIACPVLAVQGADDTYGSFEQIRRIARQAPRTQLLELAACGHSPHRDQAATVIVAARDFIHANDPDWSPACATPSSAT